MLTTFFVVLQEMQPGIRIIMATWGRPLKVTFPDQQPVARRIKGIQSGTALLHDTTLNLHREAIEIITWTGSLPQPHPSLSPPPPRQPPVDP